MKHKFSVGTVVNTPKGATGTVVGYSNKREGNVIIEMNGAYSNSILCYLEDDLMECFDDQSSQEISLSSIYDNDCIYVITYETGRTKNNNPEVECLEEVFTSRDKAENRIKQLNPDWYGKLSVSAFKLA